MELVRPRRTSPLHARGLRHPRPIVASLALLLGAVVLAGVVVGVVGSSETDGGDNCQRLFVPAYFAPGAQWATLAASKPVPATVILDITSLGPGFAPVHAFQVSVKQMRSRGTKVLGYLSTSYASRPLGQIERGVRSYKLWYGVTSIFLDEASSRPRELAYYRAIDAYIRHLDPGSTIWLNPGTYPSQKYMSLGDVVTIFEGPYASFVRARTPRWASTYPGSRFAIVVYDTPASDLAAVVRLARDRNGGHLYVTDGTGGNPYSLLPSYWSSEDAQVTRSCTGLDARPSS